MKEGKTIRTVRQRLRSNNRKKFHKLSSTAGCCRFVWNHFTGILRDNDFNDGYGHESLGNFLREFKKEEKNYFLKEASAYILQHYLLDLTNACKRYRDGKSGQPKFKSKLKTTPSFPVNYQSAKLSDNNWVRILKVGWFRLAGKNPYPDGKFLSGRIKKECGKWYAYLSYEIDETKKEKKEVRVVAMDRNSRQVTLSDGQVFKLSDDELTEAKIRRYQKKLARQEEGSNRWRITKERLQKLHRKLANRQKDWRHQVTRKISDLYDVPVLERLNTQGMTARKKWKNFRKMNRNIRATGWFDMKRMLDYKCNATEEVPAPYTSQTCSECGHRSPDNRRSQSRFKCISCGYEVNADLNAAFNQLETGIKQIIASGKGVIGRGDCRGVGDRNWSMTRQRELLVSV